MRAMRSVIPVVDSAHTISTRGIITSRTLVSWSSMMLLIISLSSWSSSWLSSSSRTRCSSLSSQYGLRPLLKKPSLPPVSLSKGVTSGQSSQDVTYTVQAENRVEILG